MLAFVLVLNEVSVKIPKLNVKHVGNIIILNSHRSLLFTLHQAMTTAFVVPPTTGEKKKARRVFGDVAADDALETSLSYSPSSKELDVSETTDALTSGRINIDEMSFDLEHPPSKEAIVSRAENSCLVDNKENAKNVRFLGNATTSNFSENSAMQDRFRSMCTFSRSPVRPDLVKKTQDAINKANVSMKNFSESIAAARQAKADHHSHRRKDVSKVRQNWTADTAEAKSISALTEQNRRKFLLLQQQLSSKYSKEKARREQTKRQEVLSRIEKELMFKSEVFRDHQKKIKQDNDDRRRQSVAIRAKMRQNHRLGEEKIKAEKFQEEQAIFEERHAASVALRETTAENNSQRRKSFAFRNGDARRIRLLHATMVQQQRQQVHDDFESKWQAEKDVEIHILKELQARRESLANRNAARRNLQKVEHELQQKFLSDQHKSYELKWDAERDAKKYIKSQEEERRQSLKLRNQDGKRQRDFMNQQNAEKLSTAHEFFLLDWAAANDAEMYRRQLVIAKRESLVFRNEEGRRQRNFAQNEQIDLARKLHESYELKWAGEKDAASYVANLEAERRESLANRNTEARRQRICEQQHQVEVGICNHESYELKRAASKDVEIYLAKLAKERRESLQFRNKERYQHAKVLEELRILALERESESFVLKWAGENDAKEYLAKLEEERRISLKFRGQQTLHHRQIASEEESKALAESHETEILKAIDHQEMETYKKKCSERDRASFEYRRKDARMLRIQEKETLAKLRDLELENQKLETLARNDVVEYVNDCKKRRRMSLASRAKEKRKHAEWYRLKKEEEQYEQSRRVRDQLMDQKYIELAQQKERARVVLNAIRHAGYTFETKVADLDRL